MLLSFVVNRTVVRSFHWKISEPTLEAGMAPCFDDPMTIIVAAVANALLLTSRLLCWIPSLCSADPLSTLLHSAL